MNPKLELLLKVLRPVSKERAAEIARALAGTTGHEQLTLEDAGVTNEVSMAVSRMLRAPQAFTESQRAALRSYEGPVVSGYPDGRLPADLKRDE